MNTPDHPNVIALPPLIFLAGAVVSGILNYLHPIPVMMYSASLVLGIFLALIALNFALWAERVMKKAGTNIRPDRPSLVIVTSGPFCFTRNPLYLSLCLLQLSLGFILDGWIPVLFTMLLGVILHFGVILREEKYLEAKFGEQYLHYKRKVRRWL